MAGTYAKLFYHLVFSTKHRQPFIQDSIERELHKYVAGVVRGIGGTCIEVNGMPDHLHLLVILPPKIAVSAALREVKANSSKWIHQTRPELGLFAWQDGFAAFSVSQSQVESVRAYVRHQKSHHAEGGYQEELTSLLTRHEVEYDPKYVWD